MYPLMTPLPCSPSISEALNPIPKNKMLSNSKLTQKKNKINYLEPNWIKLRKPSKPKKTKLPENFNKKDSDSKNKPKTPKRAKNDSF